MVLADTHLLGSRQGHWLDKWRREWQMHRAFQTAMTLHRPEIVFVLGKILTIAPVLPELGIKVQLTIIFKKILKVNKNHMLQVINYFQILLNYFQTTSFSFLLGDLFDEGKWCAEDEFNDYVDRFHKLFRVPEGTSMHVVVGNHDIGFHYR